MKLCHGISKSTFCSNEYKQNARRVALVLGPHTSNLIAYSESADISALDLTKASRNAKYNISKQLN